MKSLSIKLGVMLAVFGLTIFGYAEVWGADWKSIGSDDDFSYFYDSASITYPSKNIGRLWTKTVCKEKGRIKTMEKFRENKDLLSIIKNVDHTLTLFEINCVDKKFRTLKGFFYSKDGKILKSVDATPGIWKIIPPDTMYEAFYDVVCKAEVSGGNWKLYDSGDYSLNYYDAQSMTRPSKNIVRVWVKVNYTKKGVIVWVGRLGKKYEDLSHTKELCEINCVEKMFRSLSINFYDNKGGVIYSSSSPLLKWDFIIPESINEALYKEVCK